MLTTYGSKVTADLDITEKFSEPDAIDHNWLLIDGVIEIPDPPESSGGFSPGVTDWGGTYIRI